MTRPKKIAAIVLGSAGGLLLAALIAVVIIVQTQWFRDFARQKLEAALEDATNGKVNIGWLGIDLPHLRASVRNVVLHGREGPGAKPLFSAALVQVDLKLTSPIKNFIDISYLLVDTPQADVIVYPDGSTNIPTPPANPKSNKTALQTVVDLAIGRFDLRNGSFIFASRKTALDAHGRNLRAQLVYDSASASYRGQLAVSPLLVRSGSNQPVEVAVNIPLVLRRDEIQVSGARLATSASAISLSASVAHLEAPRTTLNASARIALEEVKRIAGTAVPLHTGGDVPKELVANVALSMDDSGLRISNASLTLGHTSFQASGGLQKNVRIDAKLATGELDRLFGMQTQPVGMVEVSGNASVNIPRSVSLSGLRVSALGGSLTGSGELSNMEQYRFKGELHDFDLRTIAAALLPGQRTVCDGVISGSIQAQGDTKQSSQTSARADLSITPGRNGIPVSGRIDASYAGSTQSVVLARSYIALPSTRLDLSGSLGTRIDVKFVSHNLRDLQPALSSPLPIVLDRGGSASFTAAVTGQLSAPRISGHVALANFSAQGKRFNLLAADLNASNAGVAVMNGQLTEGAARVQFAGSIGLHNWKPESYEPLAAELNIPSASVEDLLALAGEHPPVTGTLTASAHVSGTVGNPAGSVHAEISNGTAYQARFDHLVLQADLSDRLIRVSRLQLTSGSAEINANADYQHAADSLERGFLRLHLASNQMQLDSFQNAVRKNAAQPAQRLSGQAQMALDAALSVQPVAGKAQIQLTNLNGSVTARGLNAGVQHIGDLTASAQTAGGNLIFQLNSNFVGSTIQIVGNGALAGDHQGAATVAIANLPIENALALTGQQGSPAAGLLSLKADLSGAFAEPEGKAEISVNKGRVDRQSFDQLQANIAVSKQSIDISSFQIAARGAHLELSGSFAHPPGDFQSGQARFRLNSNGIELAQVEEVQKLRPGVAGTLKLVADGAATLRHGSPPLVSALNANLSATDIALDGKPAGNITATAVTRGQRLQFDLKSDFARADIRGSGSMQLQGDYPVEAQLSFGHLTYSGLAAWLESAARPGLEALVEGQAHVKGPLARPDALEGGLELSRLEVTSSAAAHGPGQSHNASIRNSGPIQITFQRSVVRVQDFHLAGSGMNANLSGTAAFAGARTLDLRVDSNIDLSVVQAIDPDVFAEGAVTLNASAQGSFAKPVLAGQLQLKNASFNTMSASNGLSNANGLIVFNGDRAVIQNLSGEVGGGKVTLGGDVSYAGAATQLQVQATAHHVRIEDPDGVVTELNADLNLAGTTGRSLLSGNVTVLGVALYSHTDIGSALSQAGTPPPASKPEPELLAGMRFNVRVRTASSMQVRTSLAQNVQADANLNLRGTATRPGMLGRLTVSQGEIVFFGSKFTIDEGTVTFSDPQKINPVLNLSLETTAKGITVVLNVSGPADNLKLTYTSDPPLQFSDVVSLLATGKVPSTDPVLAARQPAQSQQTAEQQGASALLNQAVASPVSGSLQRLFGVTKLQIDPQILGADNTPQARLMLEQQVSKDLLFTYMQDVSSSNPQIIRIEYDHSQRWTAILQRDENGEVALDIYYKKRF